MIVFPNAKINIGLNVVSKRDDGYHNIETVFFPVRLADALEIAIAKKTEFSTSGIHIDGDPEDNLVLKAFRSLKADFKLPELKFHLHKVIPFGAGLGGGSSDAAFVLTAINDLFNLNLSVTQLHGYASKIGADCTFFIDNKPAFGTGIGDVLNLIDLDLSPYEILIVKPDVTISTALVYNNIIPVKPSFNLKDIVQIPVERWKGMVKNDFEDLVFKQFPKIGMLKQNLYEMGAVYASMSGSGSSVYGIFRRLPTNLDRFLPKGIFIYR